MKYSIGLLLTLVSLTIVTSQSLHEEDTLLDTAQSSALRVLRNLPSDDEDILAEGSGDDAPTPPPKITKAPRTRPSPARTRTPGGKRTKHTTTVAPRTQTASARQASTPQTSAATTAPPHTTTAHQHYAASTSTEQPETPPAPTLRLPDREPIGKADIPPKPATAGHEMRSIIILASVIGVIVVLAILLSICVVIRHQRQKRKQAASRSPHSQQHIIEQEQPMLRPKN